MIRRTFIRRVAGAVAGALAAGFMLYAPGRPWEAEVEEVTFFGFPIVWNRNLFPDGEQLQVDWRSPVPHPTT